MEKVSFFIKKMYLQTVMSQKKQQIDLFALLASYVLLRALFVSTFRKSTFEIRLNTFTKINIISWKRIGPKMVFSSNPGLTRTIPARVTRFFVRTTPPVFTRYDGGAKDNIIIYSVASRRHVIIDPKRSIDTRLAWFSNFFFSRVALNFEPRSNDNN